LFYRYCGFISDAVGAIMPPMIVFCSDWRRKQNKTWTLGVNLKVDRKRV